MVTLDGNRQFEDMTKSLPEEIYDLSPQTHIYKLLQTVLGDSGLGGLKKLQTAARIGEQMASTWFGDLDVYFGGMLNLPRDAQEQYGFDPWNDQLTIDQWDEITLKDALYRARLSLFLQSLLRGGSVEGIQMAAEAASGTPCAVIECWRAGAAFASAGRLNDSREFVITPVGPDGTFTQAQEKAIYRAVRMLQPVNSICTVELEGAANMNELDIVAASSGSEYFEPIRVVHAPSLPAGVLPKPGDWVNWGGSAEAPMSAHFRTQQDQWSLNGSVQAVTAMRLDDGYSTQLGDIGNSTISSPPPLLAADLTVVVTEVTGLAYPAIPHGEILGDALRLKAGGFTIQVDDEIILVKSRTATGAVAVFTYELQRGMNDTVPVDHLAGAPYYVQYQVVGGDYASDQQTWSPWTDFPLADSPDNYPDGKYSGDSSRFDSSGNYLFAYASQQEFISNESAFIFSQGGEVNGSQYRLPTGPQTLPYEQSRPEWAMGETEMAVTSTYYPQTEVISPFQADATKGNPLGQIAGNPMASVFSSNGLFVDKVYNVQDVVSRLVQTPGALPDPRFYRPPAGSQWGTPSKPHGGYVTGSADADPNTTLREVIRVTFDDKIPFNSFEFELLNVASNFTVWYLDGSSSQYRQMSNAEGQPVHGTVSGRANPHGPNDPGLPPTVHPIPVGGWVKFQAKIPTLVTKEVEIRLDRRVPKLQAPIAPGRVSPDPYRVGVKRIIFHLNICIRDDAPPDDVPYGIRTPLGFIEELHFRDYDSSQSIDGSESTYWLSGPNPYANSVVPLFLDLRDLEGGPQRVDRMNVLPIAPGPTMNLYWSNDLSIGRFRLGRRQTSFDGHGSAQIVDTHAMGLQGTGALQCLTNGDYADMEARVSSIDFDPSLPWQVGVIYQPNFSSNISATDRRYLWDFSQPSGSMGVCFDPNDDSFKLIQLVGGVEITLASVPFVFTNADTLTVLFGYSPGDVGQTPQGFYAGVEKDHNPSPLLIVTGGTYSDWQGVWDVDTTYFAGDVVFYQGNSYLALTNSLGASPTSSNLNWTPAERPLVDTITIGSSNTMRDGVTRACKGWVRSIFFRQDAPSQNVMSVFHSRSNEFVTGSGAFDRLNGHYNALMVARFDSTFDVTVGPGDGYFDAKVWTPVNRDFVLKPGIIPIPPTVARFLKLEFSDLVGRPYPVITGCTLVHRDYPTAIKTWYQQQGPKPAISKQVRTLSSPFTTTQALPSLQSGLTGDQGIDTLRQQIESSGSELPIQSPTSSSNVAGSSQTDLPAGDNRFAPPPVGVKFPTKERFRFFQVGQHEYDKQEVSMRQQEAYFVGIKEVHVYQLQYSTT